MAEHPPARLDDTALRAVRDDRALLGWVPREGTFYWCVQRLDLGDPLLTMIARGVCWATSTWPHQLVGNDRAGDACCGSGDARPLNDRGMQERSVVYARRICYALAYELTDKSPTEIGEAFGGHGAGTVTAHWRRPSHFALGDDLRVEIVGA